MPFGGNDWLSLTQEPTLEPELPICDSHHHFGLQGGVNHGGFVAPAVDEMKRTESMYDENHPADRPEQPLCISPEFPAVSCTGNGDVSQQVSRDAKPSGPQYDALIHTNFPRKSVTFSRLKSLGPERGTQPVSPLQGLVVGLSLLTQGVAF